MEFMNPLQAMINEMGRAASAARSHTQMTLGALITELQAVDAARLIVGLGHLASYRGYYSDLAFAPDTQPRTVADVLTTCRDAMGKVFEGYKGGDFLMGERTPLWVAPWGDCGPRLMGIDLGRSPITLITAEDSDESDAPPAPTGGA